jgi:hypothetical protein
MTPAVRHGGVAGTGARRHGGSEQRAQALVRWRARQSGGVRAASAGTRRRRVDQRAQGADAMAYSGTGVEQRARAQMRWRAWLRWLGCRRRWRSQRGRLGQGAAVD